VLIVGGQSNVANRPLELYDPASGTFSNVGSFTTSRYSSTATLLPDGRVLIAGGFDGSLYVVAASLYDVGLGFDGTRRPGVTSATAALTQPGTIVLGGSRFRGDSEGSSGGYQSSPTNFPLLQLQRVDNDQVVFVNPSTWSDTVWNSRTLSTLADGPYRATVFTNGIPSQQRMILITGVAPPATPTLLSATAMGSATVAVSWHGVEGAEFYELYESDHGVGYAVILTTTATAFTHTGRQADTTYIYKVRAIGNGGPSALTPPDVATTTIFDEPIVPGARIALEHLTEIRRAVSAMRVAANLTPPIVYTDPMPTNGAVTIKAVHINELRSALDEARAVIGLPALVYTETITPFVTIVKPVHMTELRAGTQ
jgi:hypothetical protein